MEFDLGRSKEASALARHASDAQRNMLSKLFSFSSEPQRLAYLATLDPYSLFALLPGCEADLALALLRYKGVVLDSIIEDRLLAQASTNAEDRDRVERLKADQRQLDRLLLQVPQKVPEASQRVEKLEQEVEELEGQLAQHVAGLGQSAPGAGGNPQQVQARLPADCALVEYVRYRRYLGKEKFEGAYGALVLLAQGGPRWIPLGKAAQVDKLITRYRTLADSGRSDDELAADPKGLYETPGAPSSRSYPGIPSG